MQTISNSDRTLLRSGGKITLKLYFMGVSEWTEQEYDIISAKYTQSVATSSDFSIGNACAASLEMTLATGVDTSGKLVNIYALGKQAKVTWSVDSTEYPLIEGFVDSSTRKNYQTTIKMYDYMYTKGQINYQTNSNVTKAGSIIAEIASKMGVSVKSSTLTTANEISITGGLKNLGDSVLCYTALSNIACCMGGNFLINREGNLEFRRWSKVDFEDDPYEDNLDWDAEPFAITGIKLKRTDTKSETDSGGYTSETSTETYYSAGNTPNVELECNVANQAIANYLYSVLKDYEFYGGSTSFNGCLDIEAGDIVTVDSQYQNYDIAINEISFDYDGGCKASITSVGSSTSESSGLSNGGSVSQSIQNLQADYANFKTLVAGNFTAQTAQIKKIEAGEVDTDFLDTRYATIDVENVNNSWIENGTIKDGAISSAKIHSLDANKIRGGSISAGTITTGKLIVNGVELTIDGTNLVANADEGTTLSDLTETIERTLETYSGTDIPTLDNAPASGWADNDSKESHIGNIYWVQNDNGDADPYTYEFTKSEDDEGNVTYSWQLEESSPILFALQNLLDKNGSLEGLTEINLTATSLNSVKRTADKNEATISGFNSVSYTDTNGETHTGIQNVVSGISQDQQSIVETVQGFTSEEYKDDDGNLIQGIGNVLTKSIEDLSGFKNSVSETYYTKEEIDGGDYVTSEQAESVISQAKDSVLISSKKYTNSELRKDVENRNLLRNTEFEKSSIGWQDSNGNPVTDGNENNVFENQILTQASATTTGNYSLSQSYTISVDEGEKLTLSGQCKTENLVFGSGSKVGASIDYYDSSDNKVSTSTLVNITSASQDWTDVGATFSVPTSLSVAKAVFTLNAVNFKGTIYWRQIQLERGDTKTDWTHSVLDYQTAREVNASIEVATDKITSSVYDRDYINSNYSTKTQTATEITNYIAGSKTLFGETASFASSIQQNSDAITQIVSGYKFSDGSSLESRFEQTESGFNLVAEQIITDWVIPSGYNYNSSSDLKGIGAPTSERNAKYYPPSGKNAGRYYLDTSNGYLYQSVWNYKTAVSSWVYQCACKKGQITVDNLTSSISSVAGEITLKGKTVYINSTGFHVVSKQLEINGAAGPRWTGGDCLDTKYGTKFGSGKCSGSNNGQVLTMAGTKNAYNAYEFSSFGMATLAFGHCNSNQTSYWTDARIYTKTIKNHRYALTITTTDNNNNPIYLDCKGIYTNGPYGMKLGVTGVKKGLMFQNGICIGKA